MNSRHPQSRFNKGPVRGETPQEGRWYEDRAQGREISLKFTAATGMVPTNPDNFYSSKARSPELKYDTIADGLATYVSPYGDGREFVRPEEPVLTTPGPTANLVLAPAPSKGAEVQAYTPGYGFGMESRLSQIDGAMQLNPTPPAGSAAATALGMSTGVALGSGPQRNIPKPA